MSSQLPVRFLGITPLLLVAVCCCCFSSCSSSDVESTSNGQAVSFSAEFEEAGTKWTKSATATESDLKMLSGYFMKNSSLVENPHIAGDPTLYTSPNGTKRFYWGRHGAETPEWLYVQFEGRNVTVQEGAGPPLGSPSS